MKKLIKYSLIIFFFFISIYFVFCLLTNYSYERVLPPYVQTFFAIKNPKKIYFTNKKLLENSIPAIKSLEKFIPLIPNMQVIIAKLAEGPILIVDTKYYRGLISFAMMFKDFFFDKDGFYLESNEELSKIDEDAFVIKNKSQTLGFVTKKRNLLIISPTIKPLLVAKANIYMEDKDEIPVKPKGDLFSFFVPSDLLKNVILSYPQLEFLVPITKKVDYGTMSLYFEKDFTKIDFSVVLKEPKTYQDQVYAKLFSLEKGKSNIEDIVPSRAESFVTFSVENFQDIYRYLVVILKDFPDLFEKLIVGTRVAKRLSEEDFEELFFSWMGESVGSVILNGEPVFLIEVKDKNKFLKVFRNFIGEKTVISDIEINQTELPGIIGILKSIFAPSIKLPYFTIFKDFILIANTPENIVRFIRMSGITIKDLREYKELFGNLKKGHTQFFIDLGYGIFPIFQNHEMVNVIKYYQKMYGTLSLEFPLIKFEMIFSKSDS